MADTYRWVGKALDVKQIDTVTVAGTWATDDTATLTIGQKDLTYTIGTDTTTAQVAAGIKAMVAGEADPGTGDGTRNALGSEVAEFREVTATVSGAVVTITADTAGKPFTLTATESTAGDGTATRASSQVCTGKSFADNADNWYNVTDSSYEVPTNGGDAEGGNIVFEDSDVDCLYALTQLTDVSPATLEIKANYIGKIGLAATNADDSTWTYPEYRDRNFEIGAAADAQIITVTIGEGEGTGSSRINLDFGDCQYQCTVLKTATREVTGVPSILLQGSHNLCTLDILRGDVGAGFYSGETTDFDSVNVGYISSQTTDSKLFLGADCDIADVTLKQTGGEVAVDSPTASGTIYVFGGTCVILSGAHGTIYVADATLKYYSGLNLATLYLYNNGVADFRYNVTDRVVTNTEMSKGSQLYDSFDTITFTNGIDLKGCRLSDVTLDFGYNRTITGVT